MVFLGLSLETRKATLAAPGTECQYIKINVSNEAWTPSTPFHLIGLSKWLIQYNLMWHPGRYLSCLYRSQDPETHARTPKRVLYFLNNLSGQNSPCRLQTVLVTLHGSLTSRQQVQCYGSGPPLTSSIEATNSVIASTCPSQGTPVVPPLLATVSSTAHHF